MLPKNLECVSMGKTLQNSWEAWFNVDNAGWFAWVQIYIEFVGGKTQKFWNFQMSFNPSALQMEAKHMLMRLIRLLKLEGRVQPQQRDLSLKSHFKLGQGNQDTEEC